MSNIMAASIDSLQPPKFAIYKPGEVEYERSVATANLIYRFTRPHCVAQPESPSDVQYIVRQARADKLPITIKNGGHSYAGYSSSDIGVSLDLTKMNKVIFDENSKIATLQGGAVWAHAYKQLVNGRHDGYVLAGGRCPYVGVSGFTLGGGLSPFTRSFGMGSDTVKEITLVTADGNLVTVKDSDGPKSDKGRLFWALCGAGGGNFGVVVEMKMQAQKLKSPDGFVVAGRYTWSPNFEKPGMSEDTKKALKTVKMDEFMTTMNDFYTTQWPNEMTIDSSWVCDLQQTKTDFAVRFLTYYNGNKNDFDQTIDKFIKYEDLRQRLRRRSVQEKSTRFLHETLVAQWSEETVKNFPESKSYSIYTGFVFKNDRNSITEITAIIEKEMKAFREKFNDEQGLLQVTFIHSGGKASEKKRSATAYRWRDCTYHSYIWMQWTEKWLEMDMRGFLTRFRNKLRPFSMMKRASFINFPDGSLETNAHERVYYGNNRQELQRVKQIWDKDNYFNWSHGVRLPQEAKATSRSLNVEQIEVNDEDIGAEPMAHDESSGDDTLVNDEIFTDQLAAKQWEEFNPTPMDAFSGAEALGLPVLTSHIAAKLGL